MKITVNRKGSEPIQGGLRTFWVVDITGTDGVTNTELGRAFMHEFEHELLRAFVESTRREVKP